MTAAPRPSRWEPGRGRTEPPVAAVAADGAADADGPLARDVTDQLAVSAHGTHAGTGGPLSDRRILVAGGIAGLAVITVGIFDMGSPVAISFEAFLRWSAERLAQGHGLHLWPSIGFWAIPQIGIGAAVAFAHLDPRIMRLLVLPFLVAAGWGEYALSRRLGADTWWAMVAAVLLVCSPLTLALATGFNSDVPYLGLFLLSTVAGLRWVTEGKSPFLCVALVLVASAQRQYGAGILVAVAAGLVLGRSRRRPARREWVALLVAFGSTFALGWASYASGLATSDSVWLLGQVLHPSVAAVVATLAELPVLVALVGLPLLLPLAVSRPRMPTYSQFWAPALAVISLVGCAFLLSGTFGPLKQSIFPGDWFNQVGIGPPPLSDKPQLLSPPVYLSVELASVVFVAVALIWRADLWKLHAGRAAAVFIALVALSQLPAIYTDVMLDRHFLAEAALALPVLAAGLSTSRFRRNPSVNRLNTMVLGLALVEVAVFAVGEQDRQAWTTAIDRAVIAEMAMAPPAAIDAGPLNAELFDIPFYERTGHRFSSSQPAQVYLAFARLGDHEPGFDYYSVASGRVVIRVTPVVANTPPAQP